MPIEIKGFEVWENEGASFYELWLEDKATGKSYRDDKVPKPVKKRFAAYLMEKGRMNAEEAAMILGWIECMK